MQRLLVAATLAGLFTALPAAAQFQKPEDAIKYRQSVMTVMATHFGRVAAMAQGRVPFDPKAAGDNAAIAVAMSRLPFVAFGEGTDKGLPNRAKPEVWSNWDDFSKKMNDFAQKAADGAKAAQAQGSDAAMTALVDIANGCKGCHDQYREEEKKGQQSQ